MLLESRIEDDRNVDGGGELSVIWTGFTDTAERKASKHVHVVWEASHCNLSNIQARSFMVRCSVKYVEQLSTERKTALSC